MGRKGGSGTQGEPYAPKARLPIQSRQAAMQDEVRDKSVALVIHGGKDGGRLTAELLKCAIRRYQKQAGEPKHGKQSVKSLVKQGAGVQNIEVTDKNIKSFERVARKYGVDFALKKDPSEGKYLVFFKAKDADALNAAFAEYNARTLNRAQKKPSLLAQLDHFKEVVKNAVQETVKNRNRGGHEL